MGVCPNCSSPNLHDAGVQWFPLEVIAAQFQQSPILAADKPGQGALRMFTCNACHTTFLEPPQDDDLEGKDNVTSTVA